MAETSIIYQPSTFIKEVLSSRYIQLQDAYGTVQYTLDYTEFSSGLVNGRYIEIIEADTDVQRFQFTNNSTATTAFSNLMTIITQLKKGTYSASSTTTGSAQTISTDYSVMYHSGNFIKEVKGGLIQIQDRLGTVYYSINYATVGTTLVNNRFLNIYRASDTNISLQFIDQNDATKALSALNTLIDQLKDSTYNYSNNNLTGSIYDPDTFIYEIEIDDYSVRLINTQGELTYTIVATQVTQIYTTQYYVKVKTEATDNIITLTFNSSTEAIEGAEALREAIKQIVDRIPTPSPGTTIKSFSATFSNSSQWTLNPGTDFDLSSAVLEYWEYVCPNGGTCDDADLVKQRCQGLVEFVGNDSTGILDYVVISFNQAISGRATLTSK